MVRCINYHARVDGEPALVFELLCSLLEQLFVRVIAELDVNPELIAGLIVELEGHGFDPLWSHPVDIHVD